MHHLDGVVGEQSAGPLPDLVQGGAGLDVEVDDLPAGLVETDRGAHDIGELEQLVPVPVERRPGIGLNHGYRPSEGGRKDAARIAGSRVLV